MLEQDGYSLNSLIRNSLSNYEILINKYEKLLIDNTTINILIKEKLHSLPVGSEIRLMLEGIISEASNRIESEQKNLSQKDADNKKVIEGLVITLTNSVDRLLSRMNFVIACIVIGAAIGSAATYYVKSIIEISSKSMEIEYKKNIDHTNEEYMDKNGNKIIIPSIKK